MKVKTDYNAFASNAKDTLTVDEANSGNGIVWKIGTEGEKIWMGHLIVEPGAVTSAQHHEASDTVHYVYEGEVTISYGENYETVVELGKGDFIYFPPYTAYKLKNAKSLLATLVVTMAPKYKVTKLSEEEHVEKVANATGEVSVVRATELDDSTKQTANLPRKTAVQAPNLWIGRVSGAPAKNSGEHHHDEAETAGFIVSGDTRILHGANYENYEDLTTGDFLRVPPYAPHIERNLSDTETIEFLTARNPQNFVVNINNE